jgi:type II secretory pathway pseudopilin PulG
MTHRLESTAIDKPTGVGRCGFTLIEAVMSMLVVGLMMVAAMNTVGASRVAQSRNAEQSLGPMLAEDLMSEILSQNYEEPVDTVSFGRESESGGDRVDWDDVDDYEGWSSSPPENKDGNAIPDLDGWGRKVTVVFVDPGLVNTSASDIGHKRIVVTVTHMGRVVTELWGLRTSGWPDP